MIISLCLSFFFLDLLCVYILEENGKKILGLMFKSVDWMKMYSGRVDGSGAPRWVGIVSQRLRQPTHTQTHSEPTNRNEICRPAENRPLFYRRKVILLYYFESDSLVS